MRKGVFWGKGRYDESERKMEVSMQVQENPMARFLSLILLCIVFVGCNQEEAPAPQEETQVVSASPQSSQPPQVNETIGQQPSPLPRRSLAIRTEDADGKSLGGVNIYLIEELVQTDAEAFLGVGGVLRWVSRLNSESLRGKSNQDGHFDLPLPRRGEVWIVAQQGEALADAVVDVSCTDVLLLVPKNDKRLRFQVVDSLGKPRSGVHVGVCATKKDRRLLGVRPSDENGWVTFDHPKRWLEPASRSRFDNIVVGVAEVFENPIRHLVIGFDHPQAVPLPPYCSVAVSLQKSDQRSILHLATVSKEKKKRLLIPNRPDFLRRSQRALAPGQTTVIFPYVGLDLDLELQRQDGPQEYCPSQFLRGAGLAQGQVSFKLKAEGRFAQIPVRLVDVRGEPLAHCNFAVEGKDQRSQRYVLNAKTDEEGRCRLTFPFLLAKDTQPGKPLALPLGLVMSFDAPERTLDLAANLALTWRKSEYIITMKDMVTAASGMVKDGQGQPLEYAHVTLELLRKSGYWPLPSKRPTLTNAQGRFRLSALPLRGIFRLKAERFDHETSYTSNIQVGMTGIQIRQEKKSEVVGDVLVDEIFQSEHLVALFRERGKSQELAFPLHRKEGGKRVLDSGFLIPGIYDLVIMQNNVVGRLHRLEAVRIPFRGRQKPRELDPLDLKGKFRSLTLTVLDKSGKAIPHVLVELSTPAGADLSYRQIKGTSEAGIVRFLAPRGPLSAEVTLNLKKSFAATVDSEVAKYTIQATE